MKEKHPYGDFIPKGADKLIIGSFPIGKFSDPDRRSEIKAHEFDFYFGGEKNLLWKLLSITFKSELTSVSKIKAFLKKEGIGICDVIVSCRRKNGGGSDSDLLDIEWNHELGDKISRAGIRKVFFTSKKVEIWFNRLFPDSDHLQKILLISPSGQSVRSLYHNHDYQKFMKKNPHARAFDFIVQDYKRKFISNA